MLFLTYKKQVSVFEQSVECIGILISNNQKMSSCYFCLCQVSISNHTDTKTFGVFYLSTLGVGHIHTKELYSKI